MKVRVLQKNLAKGLALVSRAAPRQTTLPVLKHVLVQAKGRHLYLSATDLELGITTWISAKVEEEGAITGPAKTMVDLVKTLPAEAVALELGKANTLNLKCGWNEANIKGLDAQEFPLVAAPEHDLGCSVEADRLCTAIGQVAMAAATDMSRPLLTGVLMEFRDGSLTMAAADGFRLSVRTFPLSMEQNFSIIVPARALWEVRRIAGGQEDPIALMPGENKLGFGFESALLVSQLIDGNFPDYDQIIPKQHKTRTVMERVALLRALQATNVIAREAAFIARFSTDGDCLNISAAAETGDTLAMVKAEVEGEPVEIAFNCRYVTDAVRAMISEQVTLETTTDTGPGVLRDMDGDAGFTHVIMPMHIGREL